jgi:hypothetical protein
MEIRLILINKIRRSLIMRCKYLNAQGTLTSTTVTWRIFRAKCPKINANCTGSAAYLPAISVCIYKLF